MARVWKWVAVLLVVFAVGGYVLLRDDLGQAKPESEPEKAVEKVRRDATPVEQQRGQLQRAVIGVNGEVARVEHTDGKWSLGVEFPGVPPKLGVMLEKAMRLMTEIHRTGLEIAQVELVFRSDELKDLYGHALKNVVVAEFTLPGEQFHRIDWHGFEARNFELLADEWWVHPEVLAAEASQQGGQGGGGSGGGSGGGGSGGGGSAGGGGGDGGGSG